MEEDGEPPCREQTKELGSPLLQQYTMLYSGLLTCWLAHELAKLIWVEQLLNGNDGIL